MRSGAAPPACPPLTLGPTLRSGAARPYLPAEGKGLLMWAITLSSVPKKYGLSCRYARSVVPNGQPPF